jgi:hypothetical protein
MLVNERLRTREDDVGVNQFGHCSVLSARACLGVPYWTSRAALRMNEATAAGCESIATWLEGNVMVVAFIRSAKMA